MNGTLNLNGGTGSFNVTGGPTSALGALNLNGDGTTVDINSGITNLSSSSAWTVSMWVKTSQSGMTLLNKGDGTNWSSGYSTFYLGDGADDGIGGVPDAVRYSGGWLAGSTPVNDGNWHLAHLHQRRGNQIGLRRWRPRYAQPESVQQHRHRLPDSHRLFPQQRSRWQRPPRRLAQRRQHLQLRPFGRASRGHLQHHIRRRRHAASFQYQRDNRHRCDLGRQRLAANDRLAQLAQPTRPSRSAAAN